MGRVLLTPGVPLRRRALALPLLLALGLGLALPALAQRSTASLRGTVTDETGGVLPGVTLTLRATDTGWTRVTTTNSSGAYGFAEMPVGDYTLEAVLTGFKKAAVRDLVLNVADVRKIDLQLQLGEISEVVTTVATAIQVETVGGEVAGLVTGEQIRELPLNGRNFTQLTLLMPGVAAPDSFNTKDKGLLTGVDLSVSGSSAVGNIWTVDGANNNDVGSNRTILVYPSVDAIEEFKVHRNSYGAEFGGGAGAQINLVTRGGTNRFQGSVFGFFRDDSLNDKNFFLRQSGQAKEPLSRQDFGYTVGGPLIKDKLHFFLSQEWNQEERGIVRTGFVPTAAERAGDFSGAGIAGCSNPIPVDPLTGAPFPGNVIPADRLSPAGLAFLELFPTPNVTPASGCNNWVSSLTSPIDWNQANLRLDFAANDKTRLMLRYTQDGWDDGAPHSGEWGDDAFPAVDSSWDQPGYSLVAQANQVIGASAVNTVQFSYSANEITVGRGGDNPALNGQINQLVPAIFPDAGRRHGSERSHPIFWGGGGYPTLWNMGPFENNLDLLSLKDDYLRTFGEHSLKLGAIYSENLKNEDIDNTLEVPQFWGSAGLPGWGPTTGNILADFLLRDMTFGFSEGNTVPIAHQRWEDFELYASDSWEVHPRVVLDVGVRYSLYGDPVDRTDAISAFRPELFDPAAGASPCNGLAVPPGTDPCGALGLSGSSPASDRSLIDQQKDNFAPRLGLAWDVFGTGKTAIRAGFGQFYQRNRLGMSLGFGLNPPFTEAVQGIRTLDTDAEPCGGCFGPLAGVPLRGAAEDLPTPYNWHYNVTWEQQLLANTTLEVSYVGSRGVHLPRRSDINQVPAGDANGNGVPDRLEYVRSTDAVERAALRPFPVWGDRSIAFWEHDGRSEYNSIQTHFVTRLGRGSEIQASYTLSSLKADTSLLDSGGGLFAGATTDRGNPGLDWGDADTHREHLFSSSVVWNLPSLEGRSGPVRSIFGDWTVGGIAVFTSGTPLTVYTGTAGAGTGQVSGTGFLDNLRPNRVAGAPCGGGGAAQSFLNPAAYTLDGFQLGTLGNTRRGDCEGPDYFQVDLMLTKNIRFGGRLSAEFRVEVFNLFNRNNFTGVNNMLGVSSVVYGDAAGNVVDLADATQILSADISAAFGEAATARDPRQVQLGFKLFF